MVEQNDNKPPIWERFKQFILPILATIIAVCTISYNVIDSGDPASPEPKPAPTTQTFVIATTPPPVVTIDKDKSSDNEGDGPTVGAHEDAVDEFPDGVPQDELEKGVQQVNPTEQPLLAPAPVGGAQNYSCLNRPVVNQSGRNGQKALLFVLHFTVSKPGTINIIRSLFNTPSFGASSTFLMEFSGKCLRLMSDAAKPWTQGNFNGRSISVEIVATGKETRAEWLNSPMIKQGILASLARDTMKKSGIPLRLVNPSGCTVQKAGWTDHERLECGNSHWDVGKNFPFDVFQKQLTSGSTPNAKTYADANYRLKELTTQERAKSRKLLLARRIALRGGGWVRVHESHLKDAVEAKRWLSARLAYLKPRLSKKANRSERYRVIRTVVAS